MTDQEIDLKYSRGEQRIITETNRERLPNFVTALSRPGYMDVRPFYQRRARWDDVRQSRLIESFIMNIPVPPIFLYEKSYNSYEIMDGQQRISAISRFYNNDLSLKGLERWPELNGRNYRALPNKVRSGIDRRSISSVVLLRESSDNDEDALLLRQMVFERLNTGGVRLERQEIRNCLYHGALNERLVVLARNPIFRRAWGIPEYVPGEERSPSSELKKNKLYEKLGDAELVLRFFALRHAEHYTRGMQGFLDLYMVRASDLPVGEIDVISRLFESTLDVAHQIYGDNLFRPYDVDNEQFLDKPSKAFYDAIMVGLAANEHRWSRLRDRASLVFERTVDLFRRHPDGTFTGRGNSKSDVIGRIGLVASMFSSVAG